MFLKKTTLVAQDKALKGRDQTIKTASHHFVLENSLHAPFPDEMEQVQFGMGCFWGAERKFWSLTGVYITAVGYSAGFTPNPNYEEVCTGQTGHNETVLVVYDPKAISFEQLLKVFWDNHDPTQGMRQGNDLGTQYRSAIYAYSDAQLSLAQKSKALFQEKLKHARFADITTEIKLATDFFYAEDYHQQYLAKNPNGYCGLGGTGICYEQR